MVKKIVFTGGGTVGHVTLNLILIPKFIKDSWEVHYIGDKQGIEYQQITQSGLEVTFHSIATGKLRRYFSWQNMLDVFKVGWGIVQSLAILAKIRPQAFFSKGGFVSVPPVIAAKTLRIPVFVHESDLSMGLANKIAYRFATTMYTTFSQEENLNKVEHVGAITKIDKQTETDVNVSEIAEIKSHFNDDFKTLLFIGGSAGARVFNEFISQHKEELTSKYNIINITGDAALNSLENCLYRVDYVTDLYRPIMDLTDVVITRGGSNTLFELLALQKLQLIIPLGKEASRGDQLENAAYFVKQGYARELLEDSLTVKRVVEEVEKLLNQSEEYLSAMTTSKEITSAEVFYNRLVDDISKITKGN